MLPLVRRVVEDIVGSYRSLVEQAAALKLLAQRDAHSLDAAQRMELEAMQSQFDRDQESLGDYIHELTDLGVELKGPEEGLVDFPSIHSGRIVYLCWKLGEPQVAYWHELDAGFRGRQPVNMPSPSSLVGMP